MVKITVYDAFKCIDRYTVVIERGKGYPTEFYAMSYYADGFNLFIGDSRDGYTKGKHLGKQVPFESLNDSLKKAITNRLLG